MGEAKGHRPVLLVQGRSPLWRHLQPIVNRLAAAANTPTGTGHDLHKVVGDLLLLQGGKEVACIAKAAHNGDLKLHSRKVVLRLLPALHAADRKEGVVRIGVFSGHLPVSGPKGRLHDAAACAKDVSRAAPDVKGRIHVLLRELVRQDVAHPDQARDLSRRQDDVDIPVSVLILHGRQGALRLLRKAGHDGDAADLLRIRSDLLRKVALDHRPEHLLRGL